MKTQVIFYTQSIVGIIISHCIPTCFLIPWIILSLIIGHFINKWNYRKDKFIKSEVEFKIWNVSQNRYATEKELSSLINEQDGEDPQLFLSWFSIDNENLKGLVRVHLDSASEDNFELRKNIQS